MIYLDNSTTARPSDRVISAMQPYYTTYWGNPLTPHQKGQELFPFLSKWYQKLYAFLGAHPKSQLVLTSSGAEAINHVIHSVYRDITLTTGKNHFLTGKTDEAASMLATSHLEPFGCVTKAIATDREGIVTKEAIADAITPRTALVSLSWANGLTGVIQPVVEIAKFCKERAIRLHLDATHVMGKLLFELEEICPDYLTFNGEQLHGPRGSGILYIREGLRASPLIFGSADQGGMRAGGLNMPHLAGLATAVDEAVDTRDLLCTEIARLRNQLEEGILKEVPNCQVCFKEIERLPHCTALLFPGIANEALLFLLNRRGVCASIGGGIFQQLGLMLSACGIEEKIAHSAVSFSLSRYTTEDEIDRAIQIVAEAAKQLLTTSKQLV